MYVRQMKIEDIPLLKLKAKWMYDRYKDCFEREVGPAWIVENDGKSLCAFGALFEWEGACEVWFNLINKEHTISIIRLLKRYLVEKAKEYNVRRMQALIGCGSEMNIKFIEKMGFHNETPNRMKNKMYDGSDAYLFARIF